MISTLWWDFDGTLARRPGGWSQCLADTLAEMGYGVFPKEVLSPLLQSGFPWHTPDIGHTELADPDLYWDRLGEVLVAAARQLVPGIKTAQFVATFRRNYCDVSNWQLYIDSIDALQCSHSAGCLNVIVSNHVPELDQIIQGLGLRNYIDRIVNSAIVGWEKPNPRIYEIALGNQDPCAVAMIGDSYSADMLGPKAVGVIGVLVHTDSGGERPSLRSALADLGIGETLINAPRASWTAVADGVSKPRGLMNAGFETVATRALKWRYRRGVH
jgi:putative hydrolase of the HAD superfamily